jgi:hypothetical protein
VALHLRKKRQQNTKTQNRPFTVAREQRLTHDRLLLLLLLLPPPPCKGTREGSRHDFRH